MEERPAADSVVVDTPDHAGVHALVRRSTRSDAVPLLPVHGWPSTPADFLDLRAFAHSPGPESGDRSVLQGGHVTGGQR
ncbi:epoxide hydrolase N-terminal domain-containing protein [Pseudonocardia alni]|uniref:Epoxide hydrolase N-terminal domain-containing protein n=1 Tax=Pseudonocardia alni TaxID=33907 RepID=A0A852W771_PSEA5|nr:epoxide hydrolase N-terminal domain-containing protein [Pseudonocardia antarctica]NYG04987.1 hypothetical protein [Pseudonocardia antarctica]